MTRKLIAAAGATAVLGLAAAAYAQTAPAARPAAATPPPGPMIAGVCTYSPERALFASTVGKSVATRLQQLAAAADAELKSEQTAIENELRTLEGQRATIPQDQFQQRALTLQQRAGKFEQKRALRTRELQATQQKAYTRVATELQPLVSQTYGERNCGIMVNRDQLIYGNPQMDVTDAVIAKLNAKITTFPFERERLDTPAAQQPAARPATPAPATKK